MFLGLLDLEQLCDAVLIIPEYHAAKWEEKEDVKMNSIPFLIIILFVILRADIKKAPAN